MNPSLIHRHRYHLPLQIHSTPSSLPLQVLPPPYYLLIPLQVQTHFLPNPLQQLHFLRQVEILFLGFYDDNMLYILQALASWVDVTDNCTRAWLNSLPMAWTLSEGQCFCIVAGATILGVAAAMAFCFFELRSTQIQPRVIPHHLNVFFVPFYPLVSCRRHAGRTR